MLSDKFVFRSAGEGQKMEFALARNGFIYPLFEELVKGDFMRQVREVLEGRAEIKSLQSKLLVLVGTVTVAATTAPFLADDHFPRETFLSDNARNTDVKISTLGDAFKAWFLGKAEKSFGGSTLRYGKLSRSSTDDLILSELGGEEKAETTLTELYAIMRAQRNDERGPLLTDGYANIFYIRDALGLLRTVSTHWTGDGWAVLALSLTDPLLWGNHNRVFSRNS